MTKHDRFLEELRLLISPSYDSIRTGVTLYSWKEKRKKLAEIDLLAEKDGKIDIYEVKCGGNKEKARMQLRRLKDILPEVSSCYIFCGESRMLERI